MMKRHSMPLRIVTALVMIGILLVEGALAAAVSCTVSSDTKVYETASTSAKSVKVSKNQKVTLTSIDDSWAYITNPTNGVKAYIPVSYLTLGGSLTVYTTKATYLYKSASTSSKLVSLAKGTALTVTKRSSSYFYGTDSVSGKTGYVKVSEITTTKPAVTATAPAPTQQPETQPSDTSATLVPVSGVSCTVTSSTKIYKSESTSTKLASIAKNKTVTLLGAKGKWARVYDSASKVTGYMYLKYLKLGSSVTMYTTGSTYLYKTASTSKKLASLAKGARLTISKVYNSSYLYGKDTASGQSGYVKIDVMTTAKVAADPVKTDAETTETAVSGLSCTATSSAVIYKTEGATKLATVAKNKAVTLISANGKWAKVYDPASKVTGYMYVKYLKLGGKMTVYALDDTHLFTTTSASKKACDLVKGSKVTVTEVASSNFYYGKDPVSGKSGYMKITHATTAKVQTAAEELGISTDTTSSNSKIQTVIKLANSYLGTPYSYSAKPPTTFDCSSFTRYCYKQVGITLPGTAYTQGYSSAYTKISTIGALKVGDVVCFNTNSSDGDLSDHVGIYLGNGQFIHASSAGGKVIISTLASGYYKGVFSWARRIIN